MIVTASNIKSILNKKPTFVKKFTSLDQEYDFNFLTKFLDDNSIPVFNIKPSIEGISHVDMEDVFLIGLHGQTMYQDLFTGKNYIIEKGDLLFFPKQNPHRAISLTPRIILSVGVFGEKL